MAKLNRPSVPKWAMRESSFPEYKTTGMLCDDALVARADRNVIGLRKFWVYMHNFAEVQENAYSGPSWMISKSV